MRRLFVVLLLLALAGSMIILKQMRIGRVEATYKSCFASQSVLEGAIEMYFDDHKELEKNADSVNELINTRMDELIQGKYLREGLQDQVQGYFHELPIPKDALPVCHITAVASGTDYTLECSLHGRIDSPRPLADLLKIANLDSSGNYAAPR